jgi:hypothetical protein
MDRLHSFGSCVHDIVDHSRSLILWSAARILLKWKGIDNLILALHLRADDSHQTRSTGVAHRSGAAAPWGAHRSFAPEHSGARRHRVFGAKWRGGRRGAYPGWNEAGNGSKVASSGGSPPSSMDDDERWLWRSSGFKKQLNSFLVVTDWHEQRWGSGARRRLGFDSCGSKFMEYSPLFIGLLVPNRRWQRS